MEIVPPTVTLVSQERHPMRTRIIKFVMIAVATIVALVIIAAGTFIYNPQATMRAQEIWSAVTLPSELSSALFVSAEPGKTVFYQKSGLGFESLYPSDGARISVVRSGDDISNIKRAEAKAPLSLERNGTAVALIPSAASALAVSPGGSRYAFQAPKDPGVESPTASPWKIMVFDDETDTVRTVTEGFAPFFIDEDHVARFGPNGIGVFSFLDPEPTVTELASVESSFRIQDITQSPDRTLVAWSDPVAKTVQVYSVDATKMVSLLVLKSAVRGITLSNDSLYMLVPTSDQGTDIWRYSLASGIGEMIHHLPASLHVYRMIF